MRKKEISENEILENEITESEITESEATEKETGKKASRKKEPRKKRPQIEPLKYIRKDGKQTRVLVLLTSILFAAISTLFFIVDWTLEWGLIKIVSCAIVGFWLFFLPPAIRLSYLKNENRTPGQWFMVGYHAGASGLWMPVLLAPLFGILYFLPTTYKKKPGEEGETTAEVVTEAEGATQAETPVVVVAEATANPANPPVSAVEPKPQAAPAVIVLPTGEQGKEPAPVPTAQPVEVKVEPIAIHQPQPVEVKVEPVVTPQAQPVEVKVEPVVPPSQPEPIIVEIVDD